MIDAEAPILELGVVDRLFDLVRSTGLGPDDRNRYISTLRYRLLGRKITRDLASMRAPMTVIKKELYVNSLTDLEEWFVTHFEDSSNLFALTPVVSQSAIAYVYEQSGLSGHENLLTLFRELKRKGYVRPIKLRGQLHSRQFTPPTIGMDGTIYSTGRREILYTSRTHGCCDAVNSTRVIEMFEQNCATIQRHKTEMMSGKRRVTGLTLLKGGT